MYRQLIFALIFLVSGIPMLAQNSALTPDEIANYQEDAGYLVSYFEGTLNFLGDPTEVAAEKDIILNESYLKIFKNPEIQIEDDLDERRETPLNKNVQAYLKDVIFFYKKVNFTFHITSVEQQLNQNDQVYFKVTTNRNLEGITVAGDSVSSNLVRYFEINLDQQNKDLKIVSIYTTKLNEMEEMKYWWNNMSSSWKQVFGRSVLVYDTLPFMNILSFNDSSLVTYKWIEDPDTSNTWISACKPPPFDSGTRHHYCGSLHHLSPFACVPIAEKNIHLSQPCIEKSGALGRTHRTQRTGHEPYPDW